MTLSSKADYALAAALGIHVEDLRAAWDPAEKKRRAKIERAAIKKGISAPRRLRSTKKDPSATRRQEVIDRDGMTCRFCGRSVSLAPGESMLTIDHLLPRSRGGKNFLSNLVVACFACNHKKGDKTIEEFGIPLRPLGGEHEG